MKRIFSMMMAVLMIVSVFAVGSYAADEGMSVVEKEALAFETQPTFDGVITEAEWGAPTVEVKGSEAADATATTKNWANPVFAWDDGTNADGVIDGITGKNADGSSIAKKINYTMWFRWDAKYYYIGAQVQDPDGYSQQNNRENIWNGDCLQFKIDPVGPNGIMVFNDENYDYKTMAFDYKKYDTPWSETNSVVSIGAAVYPGDRRPFQIYDMTKKQLLNGDRADVDVLSLIYVTPGTAENGNLTTYELAVPWETIFCYDYDPFVAIDPAVNTSNQIYEGKVLGVSTVVLNATPGNKDYNAYLSWGSGICGAQHQKDGAWRDYVNGGSNAVILSAKNALDPSKTVAVPTKDDGPIHIDFVEKGIYASSGTDGHYFGINETHNPEGATVEMDIALLSTNVVDEAASMVGFVLGNNGQPDETTGQLGFYALMAGYDMSTKTFAIAGNGWQNGMKDATAVLARSDKQYEWPVADTEAGVPAEWHRLGMKVDNATDTLTLYLDGEVVLEWTDPRAHNYDDTLKESDPEEAKKQIIPYGTVERLMDNLFYGTVDYEIGSGVYTAENTLRNFSFDSTDTDFQKSPMYRTIGAGSFEHIEIKCNDAESEYGYCGHNMGKIVAANASKVVFGCYYCDLEATEAEDNNGRYVGEDLNPDHPLLAAGPANGTGDANGDGKTNIKDAMAIAKHIADWKDVIKDEANADITGDGKINIKDAMEICKLVANA